MARKSEHSVVCDRCGEKTAASVDWEVPEGWTHVSVTVAKPNRPDSAVDLCPECGPGAEFYLKKLVALT